VTPKRPRRITAAEEAEIRHVLHGTAAGESLFAELDAERAMSDELAAALDICAKMNLGSYESTTSAKDAARAVLRKVNA
jgi:hypothetical protein